MDIKTKYNLGDTVFIINGAKAKKAIINNIYIDASKIVVTHIKIEYSFSNYPSVVKRTEEQCFSTIEELINQLTK